MNVQVQEAIMVDTISHLNNAKTIRLQEILSKFKETFRSYEFMEVIEALAQHEDAWQVSLETQNKNKKRERPMKSVHELPNATKDLAENVVDKVINQLIASHQQLRKVDVFRTIMSQFCSFFPEANDGNYSAIVFWVIYVIDSSIHEDI